jgi:S-(hydroxymethyl)glutathione dehydrogenase/alcohol dehydrogenase
MVDGTLRAPHPLVLGHEAAGEVVETGAGVSRAAVGDPWR